MKPDWGTIMGVVAQGLWLCATASGFQTFAVNVQEATRERPDNFSCRSFFIACCLPRLFGQSVEAAQQGVGEGGVDGHFHKLADQFVIVVAEVHDPVVFRSAL